MEQTEATRFRSHPPEQSVTLEGEFTPSPTSNGSRSFGYANEHSIRAVGDDLDDVQSYTRCNSCWGRCMPRWMCQWWYDMWPCCRPVGMRVPRDDPMNPKTNLRLLFLTLCGIVAGLIGGFIVRTMPYQLHLLLLVIPCCAFCPCESHLQLHSPAFWSASPALLRSTFLLSLSDLFLLCALVLVRLALMFTSLPYVWLFWLVCGLGE